ncbi:L-asparagine oxygenase [Streptomyces tendae]|uniref:TauD/TfdA family dioxygenase n=1 Tax=Streptomyces tendae TaxID=1932 RepID=UPI0016735593|nr:TauD/TfdA family dioxygenase [Streptomyces tendae]GHB14512.1 L-asparagine oxygenase [Streptomyces tendae]
MSLEGLIRQIDVDAVAELTVAAGKLLANHGPASSPALLAALPETAQALAGGVGDAFRPVFSPEGLFILRGLEVLDDELGPTPAHWSSAGDAGEIWDVVLLLITMLLGRPLAWEGQQAGRVVNNIVPSRGHETEQTGASSTVLLSPHTEDAFHPERAHLLLLLCLRNHDLVGTTAASVRRTDLSPEDVRLLGEPVLPILPDDAYADLPGFDGKPPRVSAVFESPEGLTLRFDPAYTPLEQADDSYRAAYARLGAELARVSMSLSLAPGDVLVVDNDVVVHGRVPFRPRYDGTDRWLKRTLARIPGRATRPARETSEHGYGQVSIRV